MNPNLIHIIHLPHRTDRLTHLQEQAKVQGFEYQLWDGIQGGDVKTDISNSHKQIVQFAKDKGMPEICVGEDDVLFLKAGEYNRFMAQKPPDFDIYLAGIYAGEIDGNKMVKHHCGMHLYIVRQQFYDTFLKVRPNEHIDNGLGHKGRYYVCQPFAAYQVDGYSDQAGIETNYNQRLLKKYQC